MERYLVFKFSTYYPIGGALDLWKKTSSKERALAFAEIARDDGYNAHILDVQTGEVFGNG